MRVFLSILISIFCMSLNGQNKCGTKEYNDYLSQQNPIYANEKEKVNFPDSPAVAGEAISNCYWDWKKKDVPEESPDLAGQAELFLKESGFSWVARNLEIIINWKNRG